MLVRKTNQNPRAFALIKRLDFCSFSLLFAFCSHVNISRSYENHSNMRTLQFKTQPKMRLSLPSIKCSAAPSSFRLLPSTVRCLNCAQLFDNRALGRIRSDERLTLETSASDSLYGGQFTLSTQLIKPNYFIDGCEKRICEFRVHILLKGAVKGPVSPS